MSSDKKIGKNDFIEIDFTARVKDGDIFDSNIKEDIEKSNLNAQGFVSKPFILSVGNEMFVKGVDEFLQDKEVGDYVIELSPEKAFGVRRPSLVKIIPLRVFHEKNLNPYPGMMLNMDNIIARVLSVSGGRVTTDFNNPLAGKTVVYNIKVKRKLLDLEEKVKALIDFFFKQDFKFEINEKEKKITIEAEKQIGEFIKIFSDKFKEILGMDLEVKFKEDKNKEKKSQ